MGEMDCSQLQHSKLGSGAKAACSQWADTHDATGTRWAAAANAAHATDTPNAYAAAWRAAVSAISATVPTTPSSDANARAKTSWVGVCASSAYANAHAKTAERFHLTGSDTLT